MEREIEIRVTDAHWVDGYKLELSFSDGVVRVVNSDSFLKGSLDPEIRKYLDVERFKAFEINYGNLVWNDYDLCFSIEDLYTGSVFKGSRIESKVAENGADYHVGD